MNELGKIILYTILLLVSAFLGGAILKKGEGPLKAIAIIPLGGYIVLILGTFLDAIKDKNFFNWITNPMNTYEYFEYTWYTILSISISFFFLGILIGNNPATILKIVAVLMITSIVLEAIVINGWSVYYPIILIFVVALFNLGGLFDKDRDYTALFLIMSGVIAILLVNYLGKTEAEISVYSLSAISIPMVAIVRKRRLTRICTPDNVKNNPRLEKICKNTIKK